MEPKGSERRRLRIRRTCGQPEKAQPAAPPSILVAPRPADLFGLPPRVDEPIERRVAWYRNAIRGLGGVPWESGTRPEGDVSILAIQYGDLGGRGRRLKDYFAPPLAVPSPSSIPAEALEPELERWLALLDERRIAVVFCDHMSAADVLGRLVGLLERESDPPPAEGFLVLDPSLGCPECEKDFLRDLGQPGGEAA
jgi:hypothetical protein